MADDVGPKPDVVARYYVSRGDRHCATCGLHRPSIGSGPGRGHEPGNATSPAPPCQLLQELPLVLPTPDRCLSSCSNQHNEFTAELVRRESLSAPAASGPNPSARGRPGIVHRDHLEWKHGAKSVRLALPRIPLVVERLSAACPAILVTNLFGRQGD
jgi:hypothetical protein